VPQIYTLQVTVNTCDVLQPSSECQQLNTAQNQQKTFRVTAILAINIVKNIANTNEISARIHNGYINISTKTYTTKKMRGHYVMGNVYNFLY